MGSQVWCGKAVVATILGLSAAMTCHAQESRPAHDQAPASPAGSASIPATAPARIPLIREGSYIVEQRGIMTRPNPGGLWRFQLQTDTHGHTPSQLTILPCGLLAEMERIVTSMPQQQVIFEMTGQVFLYRNRNYLLPTHSPRLVGYEDRSASAAGTQPVAAPATQGAESAGAAPPAGAGTAEDVERQLERAVGSLPRSAETPGVNVIDPNARLAPEGTIVASRRGHVMRDSSGTWVFILDADAKGVSDPPMVLLPCLLLEKIEDYARMSSAHAPAIMSGRAFIYNGRNYLLPNVYRVPDDTSRLMP